MQGARAQRIEMLLLHEFHDRKFILPDKLTARDKAVQVAAQANKSAKGSKGAKSKKAGKTGAVEAGAADEGEEVSCLAAAASQHKAMQKHCCRVHLC
jgi:DNA polymerase alpha subunit A